MRDFRPLAVFIASPPGVRFPREVGAKLVIFLPPRLNLLLCILQGKEPVDVQALVPEASHEGFDQGITRGFPHPLEY